MKFIEDRPDLSVITDWLNSPRRKAALYALHETVQSIVSSRAIQRASRNVRAGFCAIYLPHQKHKRRGLLGKIGMKG